MPIAKKSLATSRPLRGVARLGINRLFYVTIFKPLIINDLCQKKCAKNNKNFF
jgi:hypothetical protein